MILALATLGHASGALGQEEPLPPPEAVLPPMVVEAAPVQHGVLRELRDRPSQQRRAGDRPGTEPGRAGPGPRLRVRPPIEAHPRVEVAATCWALSLASELVFEGDVGTTVPLGPSHRQGVEFSTRIKLLDWLTFNGNFTYTKATFDTGEAVPLAPRWTALADLTARFPFGLSADLAVILARAH